MTTPDDVAAVVACLEEGWLTMGPRTQAFEQALAGYTGAEHAVAVSSGTAALHLACLAAGVGHGDQVLVPALGFAAGAAAVEFCGAEPVPVETAAPHDLNVGVEDVERRLTGRTRALIAVHLLGYPADVEGLRALCDDRGVTLIEDCAHALGARTAAGAMAGTVGHAGCMSFSDSQLAIGEGGAVLTGDAELAAKVRSLRSHAMTSVTWDRHRGHADSYDIVDIGFNYRLDEPRAALALSKLPRVDAEVAERRRVARAYRERLAGVPGISLARTDEDVERSSHLAFPVLLEDPGRRDAFRAALGERGVEATWHGGRVCALPVRPALGDEALGEVIAAATAALGS